MADKNQIASNLDKVGQLIEKAKTSSTKLTASQVNQAKYTLNMAADELFKLRAQSSRQQQALLAKKAAITKSATEKLITQADADKELAAAVTSATALETQAATVQTAIDNIKRLAAEILTLSATPELEKLEKGAVSTDAIKAPETVSSRISNLVKKRADASDTGTVPADRAPQKELDTGAIPQATEPGNIQELEEGAPKNAVDGVNLASRKLRAKNLYLRAMNLTKQAAKADKAQQAKIMHQASVLEKLADKLTTAPVKKVANVQASTVVYAASERVLLSDGAIGVVSSVDGDHLKVSVGGVERDVLASTVKRIMSVKKAAEKENEKDVSVKADENTVTIKLPAEIVEKAVEKAEEKAEKAESKPEPKAEEKPESPEVPEMKPEKSASIADRIRQAVSMVRSGKKIKADAPAKADVPAPIGAPAPTSTEGTVGKSFTTTYAPSANGKFNVQISETEVVECDSEAEAQSLVARSNKKVATAQTPDSPTDSATTKKPDASTDVSNALKGLDQAGKDYGSTSKDEQVDPQFSMGKKSTAQTADSPTNSATTKKPDASTDVATALKGLDQAGKGYGSTSKDQVANEQTSMLKKAQLKEKILSDSNRKLAERLAVTEASLLADRAVKVGAIAEEQRSEQQQVLAELYKDAPAEFKAYSRLVGSLESNKVTPSLANRTVNRVQAGLSRRHSEVVDATNSVVSASLEAGTFFEEV